eukprot:m.399627 g.399627  ORF g.399627 m.399627 type:complete len:87 (-) comp21151_c1_seq12:101-361(-)
MRPNEFLAANGTPTNRCGRIWIHAAGMPSQEQTKYSTQRCYVPLLCREAQLNDNIASTSGNTTTWVSDERYRFNEEEAKKKDCLIS